ncbi:leucine dehydrogenase-like isoform X1 [Patiria miniata]|uniref:Glutamate/phenylalanine/leucine/valine/L-tryptophan dehydrogenase C-terminal domain-containing protein n=1 Tax=Patiria miniata TaxID=46514 RepID=A0A913ZTD5_PATMI|nr:leucine dehydrogenase-like isoform X1 [Patiria miniata]
MHDLARTRQIPPRTSPAPTIDWISCRSKSSTEITMHCCRLLTVFRHFGTGANSGNGLAFRRLTNVGKNSVAFRYSRGYSSACSASTNYGRCSTSSRGGRIFAPARYLSRCTPSWTGSQDSDKPTGSILELQPNDFVDFLKEKKIRRCFVVYDSRAGEVRVSHPELEELVRFSREDRVDYDNHEAVFLEVGARSGCLLGAFVWRTNRGQACGGIRLWDYANMEQYLRDGLRLAQGMGVKSALAGLWAGGGKGVVQQPRSGEHLDPDNRAKLFFDYGDFLSSLNGCYVAAEDVGLNVIDLDNVHMFSRYTTCISEDKGGSGNPSVATGKGVICAMEGALDFLHMGTLEGKRIGIQGAGNVSTIVVEELLKKNVSHIYVTDCHMNRVTDMRNRFPGVTDILQVEKVPLDDNGVLAYPCDIISPCALGNILNADTIPTINAKIVCGAANNQLGSPEDNLLLKERGITYIVDYLANRMGIVNCANETYGRLPDDPAINRHFGREWDNSIFLMTKKMLKKAQSEDITPVEAANAIADKLSLELHPIWPQRSQQIIQALVDNNWHLG